MFKNMLKKKYETPGEVALAVGNNKMIQVLLACHCASLGKCSKSALDNSRILKGNAAKFRKRQKKLSGSYAFFAGVAPSLSGYIWKRYRLGKNYQAWEASAQDLENQAASWKMLGDTLNSVSTPLALSMLNAGHKELLTAQANYSDPDAQQDLRAASLEVSGMIELFDDNKKMGHDEKSTASASA